MLATLLFAVTEGPEPSKTPFYIAAALLIGYAAILAFVGTARHETFPASRGLQGALMALGVLLVAGTMFTAVATA